MSQFKSATLKLTLMYLAILMAVSLAFSIVIYRISAQELDRSVVNTTGIQLPWEVTVIRKVEEMRAAEGKRNLVINLVVLNVVTLGAGTALSYWFARRTLQPIEDAMEVQSRFVSDASHELRTPLAVMKTENEIILRTPRAKASELKEIVMSNLEEVERLRILTDRLLTLSSAQPLELKPFATQGIIDAAIKRHQPIAQARGMTLTSKPAKLRAFGDEDSVGEIISILIDNAIKYGGDQQTVTVRATEHGRRVVISVSDQGKGIAEADLPRIFYCFYRADHSRSKQKVQGHGLGLALAWRLAELNNGQLKAENSSSGGAVFSLMLDKTA